MPTAKAPRRFEITMSGDTEQLRKLRPEQWERHLTYHLQRLFTGEPVALEELAHYGLDVSISDHRDTKAPL